MSQSSFKKLITEVIKFERFHLAWQLKVKAVKTIYNQAGAESVLLKGMTLSSL